MAANRFDQLIRSWEPHLQKAFIDAIYAIRNAAQVDQIARMLDRGDVDGAVRAVGLDPTQFRVFDKTFEAAYEAGGVATVNALPLVHDAQGFRVRFQFAIRNPVAEQWLRQYSSNMITGIVDDQRNMIRGFLQAGLEAGANPRTTALDLVGRIGATGKREGGTIGLTQSQEQWVRNYAQELEQTPGASLTRALRDARFDRAVQKAASTGEPLPADLRAKMVTAYRNRALRSAPRPSPGRRQSRRCTTAQNQALDQAVQSGGIDAGAITMTWRSAHDKRVRDAHRGLDGESIAAAGCFNPRWGRSVTRVIRRRALRTRSTADAGSSRVSTSSPGSSEWRHRTSSSQPRSMTGSRRPTSA
jgi:hypothetical protein